MAGRAYVDLYPMRADIAATPEESEHTSIKKRCEAARSEGRLVGVFAKRPNVLQRFADDPCNDRSDGLLFPTTDYLELVVWTTKTSDKGG